VSEVEYLVRVNEVRVGERSRKDMGDINALAESIKEVGLLHPIVIAPDKTLIAGQRRLEAVKLLGWTDVPVRVVKGLEEIDQALRAEWDENQCRKEFNPVEFVALGRKIEEIEREAAKERQAMAGPTEGPGKKENGGGTLPEAVIKGDTRDKVAAVVGVSGRTYEKAKAVVEAAEKDPDKHGHLVERMASTGKVDPAYKELMRSRQPEPAGPPRKRKPRVDVKPMVDDLMRKVKATGESVPFTLMTLREEKKAAYALKLTELARVLEAWANAITPNTTKPEDAVPDDPLAQDATSLV
jgi:ParB family chromosome partitioning protein